MKKKTIENGWSMPAKHLTALAEETPGSHNHYDEQNSLEEGSAALTIERTSTKGD